MNCWELLNYSLVQMLNYLALLLWILSLFCCINKCINQTCSSKLPNHLSGCQQQKFIFHSCDIHILSGCNSDQAAVFSRYLHSRSGGKNNLYQGHAVLRKERKSKRSTENGDASKNFCLDVAQVKSAPMSLAKAWHVRMLKVALKVFKLLGNGWMFKTL